MKKKNKSWMIGIIAIVLVAVALIALFANRNNQANQSISDQDKSKIENYRKEQDSIMSVMMQNMEGIPKSGNASIDFLKGMTPHHVSAIEMAESYLKYGGQNQELKQLAEDIMEVQTKEIADMEAMIKKIEESGRKDEEKEAAYLKEYDKMNSQHNSEHTKHSAAPSSVEQAFAEGMIMHHQMAVDMANDILDYSDEDDVKAMAEDIITAQENEIKQMKDIVSNLAKAS